LPRLGLALATAIVAGAQAVAEAVALNPTPATAGAEGALVATLSEAARQGRRVWLQYRSRETGVSERLVESYGVVQWSRA
jgi:predicted DNA-binding transcriptional regulator YafY